jgi:integrase
MRYHPIWYDTIRRNILLPQCCPEEQAVSKRTLTVRKIESRKLKAQRGKREDHRDAIVPGLALRVTETGHKSFVLVARYPAKPKNPTRRSLGDVGKISLDEAREKARRWLALIEKGTDPKVEEARQKAAQQRKQITTFAAVADEFLERHASGLKKSAEAKRVIEGEFVKRWGSRPVTDIMPEDVAPVIRAIVKRGAKYQAFNALGYIRTLFNWAIGNPEFGIKVSPIAGLKPKSLIGEKEARDRVLSDAELRAVWNAAGELGYPYGPVFQLLILTGQREREIAEISRAEIDGALLIIPATRMKGGAVHEVPLTRAAIDILDALPRFAGNHLFTTTGGEKPINGFSKVKARIDKLSGVTGWVIHDIRRSVRTRFSALPVQDIVRELVIAHAQKGLHKVYDQHSYRDEKRHCLDLWEKRLLAIVEPPPPDVMDLSAARAKRLASA